MSHDEGPVYYREIQKNAYLKRIPIDNGSKLRPLSSKKPPLKPMWTLFCVHNGRIPYLEQYSDPDSPNTLSHRPLWRACLHTARHVTASVKPHTGEEYDFLVDCDQGPVRMLAPDWDSMQDWVSTLRTKLHELKIVSRGENVYCLPPAAPAPRAPARDPTSPLPPTPPVPVPRVPGIELTAQATRTVQEPEPQPSTSSTATELQPSVMEAMSEPLTSENVDISHWEVASDTNTHLDTSPTSQDTSLSLDISLPSTSQDCKELKESKSKSVAKICGQNICLDDSILKRSTENTESDEEFFAEIDRIHDSVENLTFDEISDSYISEVQAKIISRHAFSEMYKQTLVVDGEGPSTSGCQREHQPSNVTVIKVSNKPPHTAIPVIGSETDIFDFSFKQKLKVSEDKDLSNVSNASKQDNFVNIVNTEAGNSENPEGGYGTVFETEPDYGHISLTTTVNLTGDVNVKTDGIYERLCLASTSNASDATAATSSPISIRKLRNQDMSRKSSLPNLDTNVSSTTESTYEYLFPNFSETKNNNTNITLNSTESSQILVNGHIKDSVNADSSSSNTKSAATRNHVNSSDGAESPRHITSTTEVRNLTINSDAPRAENSSEIRRPPNQANSSSEVANSQGTVTVTNSSHRSRHVERSHSQNAFDSTNRLRDHLIKRVHNLEAKGEKVESPSKPIWKRGLTELSLLSRLRGIGQRRHESPTRVGDDRSVTLTSPVKVVHRSRPEGRVDGNRRRSSSLNNGQSPCRIPPLQSLRSRQAAALRADQRRGAHPTIVPRADPPLFVDYNRQVWVAWWGGAGSRCSGRCGDRVACVHGVAPRDAAHARYMLKHAIAPAVDMLFHRVPLAKIYVLNKRDLDSIGVKLDNECNITTVEPTSPAARAGLPPPGRWAVTEVNNRPINLIKGGEDEMNCASLHGTEVSVLIQPSPLVKKIRAAIKSKSCYR